MNISVIIPTYNRYDSLKKMLHALAKQDYPADCFEVLVVDDGSKDDTPKIAEEKLPFSLRYFRQANQGATVARNSAADVATGDLLVFLDDDIYVEPGFLNAFAEAHQEDRVITVGNLQPVEREEMTVFERLYGSSTATQPDENGSATYPVRYTDVLTGMFAVKRKHFHEIGRLQDLVGDGRVAWGDVDFGYRASKLGFRFLRCMDAVGYHDDYSIREFSLCAKRWERTSESAVKLFRVYPEIQPDIPMFRDKAPVAWGKDPAGLAVKKILRQVASSRPVTWSMEKSLAVFEKHLPQRAVLGMLYRWIIGAHMYRGFREGLRKYGTPN